MKFILKWQITTDEERGERVVVDDVDPASNV